MNPTWWAFGTSTIRSTRCGTRHPAGIMENCAAMKMNMVFFQVRGNADALYRSQLEPWSVLLTGTLGQDPGWAEHGYAVGAVGE